MHGHYQYPNHTAIDQFLIDAMSSLFKCIVPKERE